MARRIKVTSISRKEPDVRLYVLALIELARQLEAEETSHRQSRTAARPADD